MDDPVDAPEPERGGVPRRAALRLLAAAPAALAIGAAAASPGAEAGEANPAEPPEPQQPSPYAKFIARHEKGLTGKERSRLRKQMPGLEGALKKVRDFDLPDDVEPAIYFRAIRSRGGNRP